MNFLETVLTRRSVRQFDEEKIVTEKDLKTILTAGMYAPSAMNKQPWEFIVIQDKETLKKITEIHPYAHFLMQAGTAVIPCENSAVSYEGYGPLDVALASENILLTAHSMGYGGCFCGVYPETKIMEKLAELLNLPENVVPIALLVLGTPGAVELTQPDRFDAGKIHKNQW